MTFGVSRDAGLFEWAGTSLSGIFAQRANLLRPAMWRMIFDIIRFNQFALDLLHEEEEDEGDPSEVNGLTPDDQLKGPQKSVGEYLEQEGYSESFRDDYLIPMTAAVWSTSPDKVSLDFPVITLVRFLWNHHLLNTISARPQWMTLENFSKSYIDAVMKAFPRSHVHLATAVSGVDTLSNGQVKVSFANEGEDTFDHVVLATHGDQALEIIRGSATEHEMDVLGGFKTSKNVAVLHSDLDVGAVPLFYLFQN